MAIENEIMAALPYTEPFLFVDTLSSISDEGVTGTYTFKKGSYFYRGHFKNRPITPGVILTECCAQIGLVCFGIWLLLKENSSTAGLQIGMSSSEMEFLIPILPNETVTVSSEKVYFRFQKLKCKVRMHNAQGELVCRGVLSGMLKTKVDG
ncbi:hydroxymyristoyl-ACP dehydratase [Aggregatimonas sangjinii]|uniref:Hydroxymyristoyl-ACP dehydratase n=1 Tax=Aggregatimonas sangjinii TaxID=2583587 RepID=A0A5B7SSH9_9FLAO|nr:hydroxymyristoyl-ACP dehydratase [Aggregatimonas sangjinii]QCW99967.1 hydroxymyristoyl-ACP dehydratase [Aggregatimonas sangjinii]